MAPRQYRTGRLAREIADALHAGRRVRWADEDPGRESTQSQRRKPKNRTKQAPEWRCECGRTNYPERQSCRICGRSRDPCEASGHSAHCKRECSEEPRAGASARLPEGSVWRNPAPGAKAKATASQHAKQRVDQGRSKGPAADAPKAEAESLRAALDLLVGLPGVDDAVATLQQRHTAALAAATPAVPPKPLGQRLDSAQARLRRAESALQRAKEARARAEAQVQEAEAVVASTGAEYATLQAEAAATALGQPPEAVGALAEHARALLGMLDSGCANGAELRACAETLKRHLPEPLAATTPHPSARPPCPAPPEPASVREGADVQPAAPRLVLRPRPAASPAARGRGQHTKEEIGDDAPPFKRSRSRMRAASVPPTGRGTSTEMRTSPPR